MYSSKIYGLQDQKLNKSLPDMLLQKCLRTYMEELLKVMIVGIT